MAASVGHVWAQLQRWTSPHLGELPDVVLLERFRQQRDESAFAALMTRYGRMVLRSCRRILSNAHEVEDAFQATFFILARKAHTLRQPGALPGFLHSIARRVALKARMKALGRAAGTPLPEELLDTSNDPLTHLTVRELLTALDEEIERLPRAQRSAVVLCCLEGHTREEAAKMLGCTEGSLKGHLERGRRHLQACLQRRGIALPAALALVAVSHGEALSALLLQSTVRAALGGGIGGSAAALAHSVLQAMFLPKLGGAMAVVLAVAFAVSTTVALVYRGSTTGVPGDKTPSVPDAPKNAAASKPPVRPDLLADPMPPGAIARLGSVRYGHESGFINQIALSPDGRTIAATAGKSAAFWDFATGRLRQRLTFRWNMRCLAFAPDGKTVAVGGEDCIVHLFDLASGKELRGLVSHQAGKEPFFRGIRGVFFAPDGRTLLSWGMDKKVRLWDTRSGKALRQIDGEDWIVHKFFGDGKLLAIEKTGANKILHFVDVETGKEVRQLTQSGEVRSVAFAPDEKTVAVACGPFNQPGRITLWQLDNGKELGTLAGSKDAVFALAFSPDGKMLASGGYDRTIRLWDVIAKKELRQTSPLSDPIYGLTFSRDGKTLISSGPETRLRLWDVATWLERFPAGKPSWAISTIAYAPDGKRMAVASSNKIWLWSPATGKILRTLEGHEGTVSTMSYSPDGKSLIAGSYDGTVRFWDPMNGKEQRRLSIGKGWVERVALSPDGKTLAVWGEATSRRIQLLNAVTGAKLRTIEVPCDQPGVIAIRLSLRFSPDSKTLYACNGNHVSLLRWDATTGKALPFSGEHDGGLADVAVCSDGRSVMAATLDESLYLWETATGQKRLVSKDAGLADTVAFSPDGRLLAVVNVGNSVHIRGDEVIPKGVETREQVRLIRVADGKVIRRFTGHLGGIVCLRFSPDGRTLASGGLDSTVLVWDVSSLAASAVKQAPPLTPEKLAELWKGLHGTAAEAHGCMGTLIAAPSQAVPFLGEKLKPVAAMDAERFVRLLKKLDSDQFAQRDEATQELKKMGDAIEPALRKAIQDKPTLETRRRLQALLDDLEGSERLRSLRAIEVLERIGDKPARDLLRRLSDGAAGTWLTEEARMPLRRLQQRD